MSFKCFKAQFPELSKNATSRFYHRTNLGHLLITTVKKSYR